MDDSKKKRLFWASFIALFAAAYGFVFRVIDLMGGALGEDLAFSQQQFGELFGASLWPIAITMIIFSMAVDKIGYKVSMSIAFVFQVASVLISFISTSYEVLYLAAVVGGLGHGIIEAVINPLCATIYKTEKSKMLNILHASWPAGIVVGGIVILLTGTASWQVHFAIMLIPVCVYGFMFLGCHFPVDERVKANVSFKEMLGEFGGCGFFLAATLIAYELTRLVTGGVDNLFAYSILFGVLSGITFGVYVKSAGKLMFFLLCLLMIPLATTELGTDGWIQALMKPVIEADFGFQSGWSIVMSAGIMMVLRFNAGVFLKRLSPPAVLMVSCIFSSLGLMFLSKATGVAIFIAFTFYAIGQTFLWPTMLGFVSERFPKGGALTLNSIAAVGLLALGILGTPFLGAIQDKQVASGVEAVFSEKVNTSMMKDASLFGVGYESVDTEALKSSLVTEDEIQKLNAVVGDSKRGALFVAGMMPLFMAACFLGIFLYFKSQGGYKQIHLKEEV